MLAFIVRRLLWTVPVALLVILFTFLLVRQIAIGPFATENLPSAVQERFNLDKPWYTQYAIYVTNLLSLDLGPSRIFSDRTVTDIISEQFPNSALLGVLAFGWALAFGIPAGILAALRANSRIDYAVMALANLGFAVPNFLVATLLIHFIAGKLAWLPTNGWPDEHWELDRHVILPSLTLSFVPMAYFARLVRGAMIETMRADYVRVATAKGLRTERVVTVHVLRNSLIPVVTAAGPLAGQLMKGGFVLETVFSVPGIGRYFVTGVISRDYFLVLGITVALAVTIIVLNFVVDVLYTFLDPRTRDG
jgi:oligopeptide transport system permease protein